MSARRGAYIIDVVFCGIAGCNGKCVARVTRRVAGVIGNAEVYSCRKHLDHHFPDSVATPLVLAPVGWRRLRAQQRKR